MRAMQAQHLAGAVTGDALGALVPVGDTAYQGDEADAIWPTVQPMEAPSSVWLKPRRLNGQCDLTERTANQPSPHRALVAHRRFGVATQPTLLSESKISGRCRRRAHAVPVERIIEFQRGHRFVNVTW